MSWRVPSFEALAVGIERVAEVVRAKTPHSCSTAVLAVPSAVIPAESNYLLNPLHRDFRRIRVGKPERFETDLRRRAYPSFSGDSSAMGFIAPPIAFQAEWPPFMYFASKPASRSMIAVLQPTWKPYTQNTTTGSDFESSPDHSCTR